jgi:exosortase
MAKTETPTPPDRSMLEDLQDLVGGLVKNPVALLIGAVILGTLYYFFFMLPLYGGLPISNWAWGRYEPQYNYEHGKIVPFIFLFLIWYHRKRLREAPGQGSNWGLLVILLGVMFYAMGARTLQGRVGMFSVPFLFLGSVMFIWGRHVARILLFPSAFLVFMIPVAAIEQATFRLQFIITGIADWFCNLVGIKIFAVGTTLRAVDDSFGFEIAEGCSGIRSLMAMVMLAAIYVHLTQDRLWKKVLIFSFATVFAIIGNAGRIVTILLVARFIDPKLAGGIYHEYSGFIFFPIALGAMLLFSKLVNLDFAKMPENARKKEAASYDY